MKVKRLGPKDERAASVERNFAAWRATRKQGARIPLRLWAQAIALAKTQGVTKTALDLRLNFTQLRKRLDQDAAPQKRKGEGFVELPAGGLFGGPECLVEIEDAAGTCLRIALSRGGTKQVAAVVAAVWGRQKR